MTDEATNPAGSTPASAPPAVAAPAGLGRMFRPLAGRDFRLLFIGETISLLLGAAWGVPAHVREG